ncbi:MAG TPA: CbtB-domain containing protein [Acidimicrobiales bacterium]|nr:CbtB-domain containing protein [Acidimicrobiales bacterium]
MENTTATLESTAPERIALPAWTWLVLALALATVYALSMENGATFKAGASVLHELFHDGRHFLGVPCH